MNEPFDRPENCAVCGKPADGGRGFSHIYHDGHPFSLCCPMCIDLFQRAPNRFARGERRETILEDLLEQIRWKNGSGW
jgi:hypothetical protein